MLLTVLGYILSWYFTRYQVAGGYVRVNTGFLFKQQRQARLDRVQAIDVVQPLLARIFGLAELRFEVADAGQSAVRLAYLRADEARQLRATILARASGAAGGTPAREPGDPESGEPAAAAVEAPEQAVLTVPPPRLVGSLLLSEQSVVILAGGIASVMLSAVTENRNFTVFLIPAAIGLIASYWSSFNKGYNFTAAISPDGIRLRYGLLDTQAQTVPPGRIQALKVSQPPLWRMFGWYRIQVNVAGYGLAGSAGEGSARTTLLPVGYLGDVMDILSLVLPDPGTPDPVGLFTAGITGLADPAGIPGSAAGKDADGGFVTSPRRARLLAPLGWRRNGFTATETALLLRSGRWWRNFVVVPHQRTQSMALQQGPLARRFRVADLVLHTTAGPVAPRLIQAGLDEARALFDAQSARARAARKRQKSEHWLEPAAQPAAPPARRTPRKARIMAKPGRLGVGIIGAGKVGAVLGAALRGAEHAVIGASAVSDASKERVETLLPGVPILDVQDIVERAELVLLAVPDDALGPLVNGLAKLGAWQPGQLVAHTSGRFGVGILHPVRAAGAVPLALHPAMTFTGMSLDLTRLLDCTFGVTADAAMLPIAQALVVEMGAEPVAIAEADRVLYHAALAHGSNHLVTLVAQASQLLRDVGVDAPDRMLGPLLRATLENALASGESALTGPVARGDTGTVAAHAGALREYDGGAGGDILEAYLAMARATARRAGSRGLLKPEQLDGIEQALGGPGQNGTPAPEGP